MKNKEIKKGYKKGCPQYEWKPKERYQVFLYLCFLSLRLYPKLQINITEIRKNEEK